MTTYMLSENDFLTFLLYEASINQKKIKKRKRSVWILTGLMLLCTLYFYFKDNTFLSVYFLIAAIAAFLFGGKYMSWSFKRHCSNYVKDHAQHMLNEQIQIDIKEDTLQTIDKAGQSEVKITEITEVDEISGYYFIRISTGQFLTVPKTNDALNRELSEMIRKHNLKHNLRLDWKWK